MKSKNKIMVLLLTCGLFSVTALQGEELLRNNDFYQGLGEWNLEQHEGAEGKVVIVRDGPDGKNSVCIEVKKIGKATWHIQFNQGSLELMANQPYLLSFWAKSDTSATMDISIMQHHDPWKNLGFSKKIELAPKWQKFEFEILLKDDDDNARLNFSGLGLQMCKFWISTPSLRPRGQKTGATTDTAGEIVSIDFSSCVNMGFSDETPNDRKGGWTDQGSTNDLGIIPTGKRDFSGVSFNIIDPGQNNGKSCLVFAGPQRDYFLNDCKITLKEPLKFKYLYLLHATAWVPKADAVIGTMNILHENGAVDKISIKVGSDVGNWWGAVPLSNGAMGWKGENKSSKVGLYVSCFRMKEIDSPVSSIEILPAKNAVWMIVAMSVSNRKISLTSEGVTYISENENWRKLEPTLDIEPGSALDFSFLMDAPAGKYGRVIAGKNGNLEFEKKQGVPVRFYGTNLCGSACYMEKEDDEMLATRLAMMGYNSVRFHHFDKDIISSNPNSKSNLDKLEYLFYCLKQKGIYITIDIYTSFIPKPGEFPEMEGITGEESLQTFKTLIFVLKEARKIWEEFARNLLTHINPYTGIAWKDDPALFSISMVNEDVLLGKIYILANNKKINSLYEKEWNEWLKKRYGSTEKLKEVWMDSDGKAPLSSDEILEQKNIRFLVSSGSKNRKGDEILFLMEFQMQGFKEMKEFLQKELQVKSLFTDLNNINYIQQVPMRYEFDYVDNHTYWDHPQWPVKAWTLPSRFHNKSAIEKGASVPRGLMLSRIFGKPYTVTEWNYVFPNKFRAEGGLLMGSYASLQDWDAIYRFPYSGNRESVIYPSKAGYFNIASDPLNAMTERISQLLYLRRDVSPSREKIAYAVSSDYVFNTLKQIAGFPEILSYAGLIHRIGCVYLPEKSTKRPKSDFVVSCDPDMPLSLYPGEKTIEDVNDIFKTIIPKGNLTNPEEGIYQSSTGEILLNTKERTFLVNTPKTEGACVPDAGEIKVNVLSAKNKKGFTAISCSSIDGKPLSGSKRLLILHLTDLQNNKIKFMDEDLTILGDFGLLPHIVRIGEAEISLRIKNPSKFKVWALATSGKRLEEIPSRVVDDKLVFTATQGYKTGPHMAYEVSE